MQPNTIEKVRASYEKFVKAAGPALVNMQRWAECLIENEPLLAAELLELELHKLMQDEEDKPPQSLFAVITTEIFTDDPEIVMLTADREKAADYHTERMLDALVDYGIPDLNENPLSERDIEENYRRIRANLKIEGVFFEEVTVE